MAKVSDVERLLPEILVLGLSQIYAIPPASNQSAAILKILSGGSLEIGGTYAMTGGGLSGGIGSTTAFTWTKGYLIGNSEVLNFNCIGKFYLAATGSTVTVSMIRELGPSSDS